MRCFTDGIGARVLGDGAPELERAEPVALAIEPLALLDGRGAGGRGERGRGQRAGQRGRAHPHAWSGERGSAEAGLPSISTE